MSGKGDKRVRTSDPVKYAEGWDRIFGQKETPERPEPNEGSNVPEGTPGESWAGLCSNCIITGVCANTRTCDYHYVT